MLVFEFLTHGLITDWLFYTITVYNILTYLKFAIIFQLTFRDATINLWKQFC